jgi:serine/threonine-protein kinase
LTRRSLDDILGALDGERIARGMAPDPVIFVETWQTCDRGQVPMAYSADEALPLGTTVNGRYRTVAIVGRGGVGTVYKTTDELYGTTYALKELADPSPSARKQFDNEAQWLQALNHPNIPKVREFFEWEERVYLVMDFVDGENLEQLLARIGGKPLPEAQVLSWALPICDALHYLHSQQPPILHRDVKPANIIVTPNGHPVLVDLGIAKEHLPGAGMTATFVKKAGTEGYAPPEQYTAAGKTGPWSDVYGMGATLYELLTGTVPPTAVERVALDSPMRRPRNLNGAISHYIDEAVTRALALRPSDRYQSMIDLARALRGVSSSAPSLPRAGVAPGYPPNAPTRPGRPVTPGAGLPNLSGISGGLGGLGPSGPSRFSPASSAVSGVPGASMPPGALGALPALDPPLANPAPLPSLDASLGSSPGMNGARRGRGAVLPPAGAARPATIPGQRRGAKRMHPAASVAVAAPPTTPAPAAGADAATEAIERSARRWMTWLGVLLTLIILLAIGGTVAVFGFGLFMSPDRSSPQATIHGYFTALSAQDYNRAWQYAADSHNNPSNQATFIASLKSDDERLGRVMSVGQVNIQQDPSGGVRATVTVQRGSPGTPVTYSLSLSLYDNNTWLIDALTVS